MSADNLKTLDDWIEYAQTVHFRSIDMTLERIKIVFDKLNQVLTNSVIILVGGTNGKGSSVAMLESIYFRAGYSTAAFTSPHLVSFNERYRVNGKNLTDSELITSFQKIEKMRENIPLTYFEFATLVAIDALVQKKPDVLIMETGMGGRLDSVNILDPDCVLLTHIALDHTQWLGDNREDIGFEKAGLFRSNIPAVCGDYSPPERLLAHARSVLADLKLINEDYNYSVNQQGWDWHGFDSSYHELQNLPLPSITGSGQLKNAAGVLMVIQVLAGKLPVDEAAIRNGLKNTVIQGRLQKLSFKNRHIVLDVAHNTDAVTVLNDYLSKYPVAGRTIAVLGMLADKDVAEVIKRIYLNIDQWELADLNEARGAGAKQLMTELLQVNGTVKYNCHNHPVAAFEAAVAQASSRDRIIVFGSFHTVGDVLVYINSKQS